MSGGPEFELVERPFLDQLIAMGWSLTTGNRDFPSVTGRETFREVLLLGDLRAALHRINLDPDGQPWLDEGRLTQAVNALQRLGSPRLTEANQAATELILKGTVVDGVDGWDQGRGQTVAFIDWANPENNTFRAVSQFALQCPAGRADKTIIPDIVLFVNGIPLVVVEAKSPTTTTPLERAIDQLQRYANRRRGMGVVDVDEGNEELFRYAQFQIATCFDQARVGTFPPSPATTWPGRTPAPPPWPMWLRPWASPSRRSANRRSSSPGCCSRPPCSTSSATSPCSWRQGGARSRRSAGTSSSAPCSSPPSACSPARPAPGTVSTIVAAGSSGTPRAVARA
jgi:hypothetical protein